MCVWVNVRLSCIYIGSSDPNGNMHTEPNIKRKRERKKKHIIEGKHVIIKHAGEKLMGRANSIFYLPPSPMHRHTRTHIQHTWTKARNTIFIMAWPTLFIALQITILYSVAIIVVFFFVPFYHIHTHTPSRQTPTPVGTVCFCCRFDVTCVEPAKPEVKQNSRPQHTQGARCFCLKLSAKYCLQRKLWPVCQPNDFT